MLNCIISANLVSCSSCSHCIHLSHSRLVLQPMSL